MEWNLNIYDKNFVLESNKVQFTSTMQCFIPSSSDSFSFFNLEQINNSTDFVVQIFTSFSICYILVIIERQAGGITFQVVITLFNFKLGIAISTCGKLKILLLYPLFSPEKLQLLEDRRPTRGTFTRKMSFPSLGWISLPQPRRC